MNQFKFQMFLFQFFFIYNNGDINIQVENQQAPLKLQAFNPDEPNDLKNLTKWFCSTIGENTQDNALDRLNHESCIQNKNIMCQEFKNALKINKVIDGLSKAECVAVIMYSTNFYTIYNKDIRNGDWKKYNVFTALLQSAIQTLDKLDPLPPSTTLYRGLSEEFEAPNSKRIYFQHFISTSSDLFEAQKFGQKTIIQFIQVTPIIAANIMSLSKYPYKKEIMLSPFEAFEFVNKIGNVMRFKTASIQELLTHDGSININACKRDFSVYRDSSVFITCNFALIFTLFILQM